ncbi:patatin-like phospholipase family protein [Antrihabitans stalactiti]|uniref:Patatin-like phospholipase family protein n=1 Tax=Antrihabitans stalactiti TaxID=2584121 RepID=A0A848KCE8_9NOCA|nr:patatin-like phospholipase family protein [Antrihabitans stalactiti]NMN95218.1 patatin-like phospholipase family protein [Antrihabitans stalactiti]
MKKNGKVADIDDIAVIGEGPVTDVVEAPEEVGLARTNPTLALQHMEAALCRADLEHPEVLTREEFRRLRYLISFARLTDFEPGVAGPGGTRGRGDVNVTDEVAPLRSRVLADLHDSLRVEPDLEQRLVEAKAALVGLIEPLETARKELAENHSKDFSLAELDAEVGYKSLVSVFGGGGGAGYVYLGALQRMLEEDLIPAYVLSSSIGAVIGSIFARSLPVPLDEYIEWAKTLELRKILSPETGYRKHGLTSIFSLKFDEFADNVFRTADGAQMRMKDQAIPFETVVAGVRKQSFDRLPGRFRRSEFASLGFRAMPHVKLAASTALASRLWQVAAFVDTRVVKPIVLGADDLTAEINVIDAVGFSASIPGVLHHESHDPRAQARLDQLLDQHDVAALVDGGAASNVPAELAWKRVQSGKLGTRNACYFVWDCLHPQWNPRHLWLQPLTQALQVQMVANAPHADRITRFAPTLSLINLAPSPQAFDRATGWGRDSIEASLPFVKHMLEPIWWEGTSPPKPKRPRKKAVSNSVEPRPMSEVLEAARTVPEPPTPAWRQITRRVPGISR